MSNIVSRKVKSPLESIPIFSIYFRLIILLLQIDSKQNKSDSKIAQADVLLIFDLISLIVEEKAGKNIF